MEESDADINNFERLFQNHWLKNLGSFVELLSQETVSRVLLSNLLPHMLVKGEAAWPVLSRMLKLELEGTGVFYSMIYQNRSKGGPVGVDGADTLQVEK